MTPMERPDLDGLRLMEPGQGDVWLIFHGRRHRIVSPTAYDRLFSEITAVVAFDDVGAIALGPEIPEEASLVRGEGSLPIYLVTPGEEGEVRRHFIPTYESLCDFGFDEGKVRDVPPILLRALPSGPDLVSAPDRSSRR